MNGVRPSQKGRVGSNRPGGCKDGKEQACIGPLGKL